MNRNTKIFFAIIISDGLIVILLIILYLIGLRQSGQLPSVSQLFGTARVTPAVLALSNNGHTGPAEIYPQSNLTPGTINPEVTQETIGQTICTPGWTATVRPSETLTNKIKEQVIALYGYPDIPSDYELDHFISLELGGAPSDTLNLWPESYGDLKHPMTSIQRVHSSDSSLLPGSIQKDKVETSLKTEVCSGKVTLQRAQQIIVSDWYACYLQLQLKLQCN